MLPSLLYFMVIWLIFCTPILNKILFPNGKLAFDIIRKLAQKEFGSDISTYKDYLTLKGRIIKELKDLSEKQFEEYSIKSLVHLEHLKQNDFGNYMGLKFSYWAIVLATVSMFNSSIIFDLFEFVGIKKNIFILVIFVIFNIFLLIMANTIRNQHNQLEYINFKMLCINTIIGERERLKQNKKKQ